MNENLNSKAFKSGIWYTVSNFLVKSIGFITTPIFTRLLTHSEFGVFNNYTSWLSILTIFVTLNLESTLISARFDYEDDFEMYIFSMLSLSMLNTFIWAIIFNMARNFWESFLSLNIKYINIMLVYLFFLPAVNMFQTRERYYYEYKKNVIISIILSVGTALLSVVLVTNMNNRIIGRIIGSVVPTVFLGIIFGFYFYKKGKRISVLCWKYAIPICLPYIPHMLSMTLLNSTDRVMITKICGAEQTALYSLAYTCGTMITLLLNSLNAAFVPWLGEKINKKKYMEVRKFSYIYIAFFFFITIGIMLVSPEVLYILGGRTYMEAVYVMAPVTIGCLCQFIYTMLVNIEQFKKKTLGMALGSIIAALVNFVLNLVLIPIVGYLVAAYTTLIGYIVLLLIHMILVKNMGLSNIYDYGYIRNIVIIGMILMVLITVLYSHLILRYIFILIYICLFIFIVIKNKNIFFTYLKKGENKNV